MNFSAAKQRPLAWYNFIAHHSGWGLSVAKLVTAFILRNMRTELPGIGGLIEDVCYFLVRDVSRYGLSTLIAFIVKCEQGVPLLIANMLSSQSLEMSSGAFKGFYTVSTLIPFSNPVYVQYLTVFAFFIAKQMLAEGHISSFQLSLTKQPAAINSHFDMAGAFENIKKLQPKDYKDLSAD